jgi:hypothetical protein
MVSRAGMSTGFGRFPNHRFAVDPTEARFANAVMCDRLGLDAADRMMRMLGAEPSMSAHPRDILALARS